MGNTLAERVYPKLPISLQNAVCWYYGRREARSRYSRLFHEELARLMESEWWSADRISEHQDEELRRLVAHAYLNVPYYREVMRERGLRPADIRSRADLPRLPLLTKEAIREHRDALLSTTVDRRRLVAQHTSGTTGTSLTFYVSPECIATKWALPWRHRARFGIEYGTRCANFTGKLAVPMGQASPPFWRWSLPLHQAFIGMHHIVPGKIRPIIEFLDREGFAMFTGYPSIVHNLARTAAEAGLELSNPPRVVALAAENTYDFQREEIAAFTGAEVTDMYGMSEACGNASPCTHGNYHEDFEFGILECADPEEIGDGLVRGRILCTGFASPEFPFIRYDVGDVGVWDRSGRTCPCGRQSPFLVSIEGRTDDYVLTPEGNRIMRFDYLFKSTEDIRECQVVQHELGEIVIRVVRRPGYGAATEEYLRKEVRRWISPIISVAFEYVDEIERGGGGKFKAVRSFLPKET